MSLADPMQKFQDWFTQQWVILWGRRIKKESVPWLIGPFGQKGAKADDFIYQLAKEEGLKVERNVKTHGLIPSIDQLILSDVELSSLSKRVIDFYENTANYKLIIAVKWNPLFKFFGILVNQLFSHRIDQLNIPTRNIQGSKSINSEIITLSHPETNEVKYTIWYRTFVATGQVLYSGVYSTCTLPSGETCVKAAFPLPNGNATVIMSPKVGANGELMLNSSGNRFGDAGFYFLLRDSKKVYWAQYLSSFLDQLKVYVQGDQILAEQTLTLWGMRVVRFNYKIVPHLV